MSPTEYLAALAALGFTVDGAPSTLLFARFCGRTNATAYRWKRTGPSSEAATLLRLMRAAGIDAATAQRLLG